MADLMNDIYLRLGTIQADQESMKQDIGEIKKQVAEVRDFKIQVVAYCAAASAMVTAGVAAIGSFFTRGGHS